MTPFAKPLIGEEDAEAAKDAVSIRFREGWPRQKKQNGCSIFRQKFHFRKGLANWLSGGSLNKLKRLERAKKPIINGHLTDLDLENQSRGKA